MSVPTWHLPRTEASLIDSIGIPEVPMAHQEQEVLTPSFRREEPTPASIWYSLARGSITDEFLDWPADMFALTEIILGRTEVYRFVFSPPSGLDWPPSRITNWSDAVEEAGR